MFDKNRIGREYTVSISNLPHNVEDWLASWNTVNDGYVRVELDALVTDEDVATDETVTWVSQFREAFPDAGGSILVGVDY